MPSFNIQILEVLSKLKSCSVVRLLDKKLRCVQILFDKVTLYLTVIPFIYFDACTNFVKSIMMWHSSVKLYPHLNTICYSLNYVLDLMVITAGLKTEDCSVVYIMLINSISIFTCYFHNSKHQ